MNQKMAISLATVNIEPPPLCPSIFHSSYTESVHLFGPMTDCTLCSNSFAAVTVHCWPVHQAFDDNCMLFPYWWKRGMLQRKNQSAPPTIRHRTADCNGPVCSAINICRKSANALVYGHDKICLVTTSSASGCNHNKSSHCRTIKDNASPFTAIFLQSISCELYLLCNQMDTNLATVQAQDKNCPEYSRILPSTTRVHWQPTWTTDWISPIGERAVNEIYVEIRCSLEK